MWKRLKKKSSPAAESEGMYAHVNATCSIKRHTECNSNNSSKVILHSQHLRDKRTQQCCVFKSTILIATMNQTSVMLDEMYSRITNNDSSGTYYLRIYHVFYTSTLIYTRCVHAQMYIYSRKMFVISYMCDCNFVQILL